MIPDLIPKPVPVRTLDPAQPSLPLEYVKQREKKKNIVTFSPQELLDLRRRPLTPRLAILRHMERQRLDRLPVLSFSPADDNIVTASSIIAMDCIMHLFPGRPNPVLHVRQFLAATHRAASTVFGTAAAQSWGDNYQFPPTFADRDSAALRASGNDVSLLALHRRLESIDKCFSRERVIRSFGVDGLMVPGLPPEDFSRLLKLAHKGVSIPVPQRFRPISQPAPLRAKYIQVRSAVHKILTKQIEQGTVLLLPLAQAQAIPGIHLQNSQHWTTKKGKECGRIIADLSNTGDPESVCPLNGYTPQERAILTDECIKLYGPIKLPTITELLHMILLMADEHGWANIQLWKMDLKGAFNLLWFDPTQVPLLAFPLTDDLVIIHLVGIFGWLGMPFAFNVLSRTLLILIFHAISGKADMYVDDVMGCSTTASLDEDMHAAHNAITGLAGEDSVAPDKVEKGRSLEFIGWVICLESKTITASPRLILKTTQALFCFDTDDRVSQLHLQRLASLMSRLSLLCSYMRPFTRHIEREAAKQSRIVSRDMRIW